MVGARIWLEGAELSGESGANELAEVAVELDRTVWSGKELSNRSDAVLDPETLRATGLRASCRRVLVDRGSCNRGAR